MQQEERLRDIEERLRDVEERLNDVGIWCEIAGHGEMHRFTDISLFFSMKCAFGKIR